MDELAARTGRQYGLVDYHGAPDADRVVIVMGSAAGAVAETVDALVAAGERVGMLQIRLFQPFPAAEVIAALPATTRAIAVLDRTKEPGAVGEPLYLATIGALAEASDADSAALRDGAPGDRRPLWPVVEGDDAIDDQADLRRTRGRSTPAPLHGRHLRRRDQPQPADRPRFPHAAAGRRGPGHVLRARLGWHGRGQQGVGQDHRRGHRPVHPGLLRLRLEEVRLDHRVAPAVRAGTDPLHLPHRRRRLRRLPPVRDARQDQDPRVREAWRDLPAQLPVRTGRGLGAPAGWRPAAR